MSAPVVSRPRVLDMVAQGDLRAMAIEDVADDDDGVLVLLANGDTRRLFADDGPLVIETTGEPMTAAIQRALAALPRLDSETAHRVEDGLHRRVLQAIADGAPDAATLAREALKTRAVKFARWYA